MDLRVLLSQIEYLGVDCQPLRDLISKSQSDSNVLQTFAILVSSLSSIVSNGRFTPNSSPLAVEMVLRQLKKGLVEYKPRNKESDGVVIQQNSSPELLQALLDLKKEITDLKNKPTIITNPITSQPVSYINPPELACDIKEDNKSNNDILNSVFINPLDDKKFNDLKGNVSIEEKKSNNVADKISKLKQLKNKP